MNAFLRWLLGMCGAVVCAVCLMLLVPSVASAQCANGVCRVSSYGGGGYGGGYGSGFSVGMGISSGWSQPSYPVQSYAPQYSYAPHYSQPAYYAPPVNYSQPAYYSQRTYNTPYRSRSVTRVYGGGARYADGGGCGCGNSDCTCGPGCNCANRQR